MQKNIVEMVDMDQYELKNPQITIGKSLGSGAFSTVFRGDYQRYGEIYPVAIKFIRPGKYADEDFKIEVENNIFLSKQNIKNIIRFYGFCFDNFKNWMIFELVHCTLAEKIRPSICGMRIVNKHDAVNGKFFAYNSYLLLDNFNINASFFYSDFKNKKMTTIPINRDQYFELKKIYRDKFHEESLLLSEQLDQIEKITGHILKKEDGLPHQKLQYIFWQATLVLNYFEKIGFVNTDWKPNNMGLTYEYQLKLLDFGLSFPEEKPLKGPRGSGYYMAPEVWNIMYHNIGGVVANTLASDRYSFALLLYCAFVSGDEYPYNWIHQHEDLYFYVVTERKRPLFPDTFNDPILQEIIHKGWSHNPANRPTAAAMLEMFENWIKKTSPDLHQKIRIESENKNCKSSDNIAGYSGKSTRNFFFKYAPIVEDPVVSDYLPGLWK